MKVSKSKVLVVSTIVTTIIYLVWRTLFTLPFGCGAVAVIFGIALLLSEIFGMFEQIVHFKSMTNLKTPEKPEVEGLEYPTVDVLIATYNEPIELLFKTVNGCINMEYPDKNKVNIFLCDDGNRMEVRELAEQFKIGYLARTEHKGAKAGNLNHGLAHSSGELVVTFDADMIPMSNFLMDCVPYFMKDLAVAKRIEQEEGVEARLKREGKIGFVQTPQSFYNLDLFQYNLYSEDNIPNEQDYFYRDIQLAKNETNSVIYGGSNTILSREALEEIGGFVTNVITEDFATGMLIQSKGYQCIATDQVYASGLSPEDLKNLIKQRRRWARGCIQTGRKWNILFRKGLNMSQKISYLVSIAYWYDSIKRFIYMLAPIMYSVFGVTIFIANPLELLVFWLPMYWINSVTIKHLSGNIRTLQWTNIYETIMFPLLLKDVLFEIAGLSEKKFAVTTKGTAEEEGWYHFKMAIPHMILAGLTCFGMLSCIYIIFSTGNVAISFLLFWLVINMYNLVMALFFMLGRKSFRKSERFAIEAHCEIKSGCRKLSGKTCDISGGGFSIISDLPQYMDPETEYQVTLQDGVYQATFWAKIVQVMRRNKDWKYAFQISDIKEKEYKQLLQILHDRLPPLTTHIREDIGFYDCIKINFLKRTVVKSYHFSRKLSRITFDKKFLDIDGDKLRLLSFDYWYVSLSEKKTKDVKEKRVVEIGSGIILNLEYERTLEYGGNKYDNQERICLYRIANREAIYYNPAIHAVLLGLENEFRELAYKRRKQEEKEFDEMEYLYSVPCLKKKSIKNAFLPKKAKEFLQFIFMGMLFGQLFFGINVLGAETKIFVDGFEYTSNGGVVSFRALEEEEKLKVTYNTEEEKEGYYSLYFSTSQQAYMEYGDMVSFWINAKEQVQMMLNVVANWEEYQLEDGCNVYLKEKKTDNYKVVVVENGTFTIPKGFIGIVCIPIFADVMEDGKTVLSNSVGFTVVLGDHETTSFTMTKLNFLDVNDFFNSAHLEQYKVMGNAYVELPVQGEFYYDYFLEVVGEAVKKKEAYFYLETTVEGVKLTPTGRLTVTNRAEAQPITICAKISDNLLFQQEVILNQSWVVLEEDEGARNFQVPSTDEIADYSKDFFVPDWLIQMIGLLGITVFATLYYCKIRVYHNKYKKG